MAEKPKKRIKMRVKEGEQVEPPKGYILNPKKSSERKKVFDLYEGRKAKIKLDASGESPSIPQGYTLDESKSKPGKDVYVKKTMASSMKPSESQYREATEGEKKAMEAGTFYSKNEAQYRDEKPVVTEQKSKLVVKGKKQEAGEPHVYTNKERRKLIRQSRPQYTLGERLSNFLPKIKIGKGNKGSVKCPVF